jgi:hypothetical protein
LPGWPAGQAPLDPARPGQSSRSGRHGGRQTLRVSCRGRRAGYPPACVQYRADHSDRVGWAALSPRGGYGLKLADPSAGPLADPLGWRSGRHQHQCGRWVRRHRGFGSSRLSARVPWPVVAVARCRPMGSPGSPRPLAPTRRPSPNGRCVQADSTGASLAEYSATWCRDRPDRAQETARPARARGRLRSDSSGRPADPDQAAAGQVR